MDTPISDKPSIYVCCRYGNKYLNIIMYILNIVFRTGLIIFLVVNIVMIGLIILIPNAEAQKPYRCQDHYSWDHCVKIGAVKPIEDSKTDTSTPEEKAVTPDLPSIEDSIDEIEDEIRKLEIRDHDLRQDAREQEVKIFDFERKLERAEKNLKDAKADYRDDTKESTRLKLVDAEDDLKEAKDNLAEALEDKKIIAANISKTNKAIQDAEKILKEKVAQGKEYKDFNSIGIRLSQTCITLIKNNMSSTCPDYRILQELDFDTSHKYSGEIKFFDGYWHREPFLKNDHMIYDLKDEYNIFLDPSGDISQRVRMITITSGFNQYLLAEDLKKHNDVRTIHKDRFVSDCNDALINANTWLETLADTINYLRTGCKGTLLNTVEEFTDEKTHTDIDTSFRTKHNEWLAEVKEKYKISYLGSNEEGSNKSVIQDEDEK